MATKSDIAKSEVERKIALAFGDDFIGVQDKKIYVWADAGGERIQIAIGMTAPKVWIEESSAAKPAVATPKIAGDAPPWEEDTSGTGWDFSAPSQPNVVATPPAATEITKEEKENIATLMARLGL
jgi:hypothetical protein